MIEEPELDLGLPPSTKRKRGPAKPTAGIVWRPYKVNDRRLCEDCMAEMPTVGGVPVHAVNKAFHQRKEGTTVGYYCSRHHQDRLTKEGS